MEGAFSDSGARSRAFLDKVHEEKELRDCCDSQVRLLNELGFTATRKFARTKYFIELFPHGPIFFWLIAGPYIEERRDDTGTWYARHLLVFTMKCLNHVIKKKQPLALRSFDGAIRLEVRIEDMERMQARLVKLLN